MSTTQSKQPDGRRRYWAAALAVVLLAVGEVAILAERSGLGTALILLGVLVVLGDQGLRYLASRPPAPKPAAKAPPAKASRPAAAAVPALAGAPAVGVLRRVGMDWALLWDRLIHWRPQGPSELSFPRWWLLVPAGLLVVVGQMAVVGGKVILPFFCISGAAIFAVVYLQDRAKALIIPSLGGNVKALVLAGLGLPLQVLGGSLMWHYQHVMGGFGLVVIGGAWTLWSLSRWPLDMAQPVDKASTADEWAWAAPADFMTWNRWKVKAWLVLGAVVAGYLAAYVFPAANQGASVACAFLAIILLICSFPWLPGPLAQWMGLPKPVQGASALALALVALALGFKGQGLVEVGRVGPGLAWFLGAGILSVLAMGPRPLSGYAPEPEPQPPRWAEVGLLLLLVAAAWAIHVWKIDIFPYGAEGDEAGGGQFGWDVLHGAVENPLISQNVPLQFFSVTAFFFKLMGLSVGAMRMHAVTFGTLSIAAGYLFFRLFCGWAAALAATLLMLGSYWHIHYSRFGHYNIEQVFTELVAFYFVFKGLRTGRYWLFVAAGVAFGLAMQAHLASRLLPFEGIALVLFLFLRGRGNLRRHFTGLLAFVIASWVIASPALMYWLRATGASFGRATSVSIFDKTNSNAPADVLSGFVRNCKVSMMMFNQDGDTRSRDNPLAPQKMLETGSAVLFALALAYALYQWREPGRFFLLAVFFINLSASVFSVEAPQSLRTAGNIPIVFAFIALWLGDLSAALSPLGRRLGLALFLAIILPMTTVFAWRSAKKYFVERSNLAFDVAPTYIAYKIGQVGTENDLACFWASGFACSHPPVLLFKKQVPTGDYYNIADDFPVSVASDKRHLQFLADDYEAFDPWVQSLYPTVKPESMPDKLGGRDIATFWDLTPADIASIQGVAATSGARSVTGTPLAWPVEGLPGLGTVHYSGSLSLHWFGLYTFKASGRGDARLALNGTTVYERKGGVALAKAFRLPRGLSRLQAEIRPAGPQDKVEFSYTGAPHPARQFYSLREMTQGPLTRSMTFVRQPEGLYGRYYLGPLFQGDAVMEYAEPSLLAHWLDSPFTGAWSAVWKAKLKAPMTGTYGFHMLLNGAYGDIWVGGKLVWRSGSPVTEDARGVPQPAVQLKAGQTTSLVVRMSTGGPSWMELDWSTPDGKVGMVPPNVMEPDPR